MVYWVVLLTPLSGDAWCFDNRAAAFREVTRWVALFETPILETDGRIWILDISQSELGT